MMVLAVETGLFCCALDLKQQYGCLANANLERIAAYTTQLEPIIPHIDHRRGRNCLHHYEGRRSHDHTFYNVER